MTDATSIGATLAAPPAVTYRKSSLGRRVLLSLFLFVPFVLVTVFWWRSRSVSDYGAAFTPSGNIQGIASHRGRVLLAISDLNLGTERALTCIGDSVLPEEFADIYDLAFASAPKKHERFGFGVARSSPGDSVGNASHIAVAVPHWSLAVVTGLLPLGAIARTFRRWRRARRGLCVECGYDLRESKGRCPECGTEPKT